ncbi:MAG: PilZ domain-containing protein [Myxococcota bacterium]|nr:PilZ domain-containing protein [Myxococcota bacterium]
MNPSANIIAPRPRYGVPFTDAASLTDSLKFMFSQTQPRARTSNHRERRATPRIPIELCCEEVGAKRPYYRTTFDLSTFGLSTQSGRPHPVGTLLELRLHLPDDLRLPLELRAEVVGSHRETDGMRLAFRQPSAEAVRRIHRYLFNDQRPLGQA